MKVMNHFWTFRHDPDHYPVCINELSGGVSINLPPCAPDFPKPRPRFFPEPPLEKGFSELPGLPASIALAFGFSEAEPPRSGSGGLPRTMTRLSSSSPSRRAQPFISFLLSSSAAAIPLSFHRAGASPPSIARQSSGDRPARRAAFTTVIPSCSRRALTRIPNP